jgi:hypothetical protein
MRTQIPIPEVSLNTRDFYSVRLAAEDVTLILKCGVLGEVKKMWIYTSSPPYAFMA